MDQVDDRRRVAFVTGAAAGIGAAIALAFARQGWDLALSSTRPERLADTADKARAAGAQVLALALDQSAIGQIERAVAQVFERYPQLDALICNAGVTSRKPVLEVDAADWDALMQVNVRGTFFLCQQVGRRWIERARPGCIVTLASAHGVVGFANRSLYGTSKAAIMQMTRLLAIEWAQHGIRANAVAPGTVDTPSREAAFADPALRKPMLDRIPLHRFATMDEVAQAVCFLAGPHAGYITGQTLLLDGGLTAQ